MCDQYSQAHTRYTRAQALRAAGVAPVINYREIRSPSADVEESSPPPTPFPKVADGGSAANRKPSKLFKKQLKGDLQHLWQYLRAAQAAPLSRRFATMSDEMELLCRAAAIRAPKSSNGSRDDESTDSSPDLRGSRLDKFSMGAYNSQ